MSMLPVCDSKKLCTAENRRYLESFLWGQTPIHDGFRAGIDVAGYPYQEEGRDLRASEPRDLVERSRDICHLYGRPFELTPDGLEIAWMGYFGNH